MGKISFEFFNVDSSFSTQGLEMKHDLEKAEKIPILADLTLKIDFEKYKNGIVWEDFKEIPLQLREQLQEISNYKEITDKLQKILDQFRYIDYVKADKIPTLAEQAKTLFERTQESKHFKNLNLHKAHYLNEIEHTINKEVERVQNIKPKTSIRDQKDFTKCALRNLESDITVFRNNLISFDPSK